MVYGRFGYFREDREVSRVRYPGTLRVPEHDETTYA